MAGQDEAVMASVPVKPVPTSNDEDLRERFARLADAWEHAVSHHSSASIRTKHPTYQAIIALGPDIVPQLLRDLENNQRHWFAALVEITGVNPVAPADRGNIPKMIEAWLQWGRENGYQW